MQGLITDIAVLGELVRLKSSKLDRLLKDLHLPWPILVTKWFICLYAEVLPVEVSYCDIVFIKFSLMKWTSYKIVDGA